LIFFIFLAPYFSSRFIKISFSLAFSNPSSPPNLYRDRSGDWANAGADPTSPALLINGDVPFPFLDHVIETGSHTALAVCTELPVDDRVFLRERFHLRIA
jgi:hypothetical protein